VRANAAAGAASKLNPSTAVKIRFMANLLVFDEGHRRAVAGKPGERSSLGGGGAT